MPAYTLHPIDFADCVSLAVIFQPVRYVGVGDGRPALSEVMVLGRWWRGRAFGREDPKEPTAARKEPTGPFSNCLSKEQRQRTPLVFFENELY